MEAEQKEDVVIYCLIIFIEILQKYLTITGWIRIFYEKPEKKRFIPKWAYSFWVLVWLLFTAIFTIRFTPTYILALLIGYRIWEMFIVNVWLFLIHRKISRTHRSPFVYIRILLSLVCQYMTVWMGYSFIFRIIYRYDVNAFVGIKNDTVSTWLYYSMSTLTTLGYGDIHPCQNCSLTQFLVITEVFLGILYVVWFLGSIITEIELEFPDESIIGENGVKP